MTVELLGVIKKFLMDNCHRGCKCHACSEGLSLLQQIEAWEKRNK